MDARPAATIVAYCLTSLVSLGSIPFLFKRAFPPTRDFPSQSSSIQYLAIRCRVLLALAFCVLVDASNNVRYWSLHLGSTGGPTTQQFIAYRLVWCFSFMFSIDLITLANAMRCAVIVLRDLRARSLFLAGILVMCIVIRTVSIIGAYRLTYEAAALGPNEWDETDFMPPAILFLSGTFPVVVIISSAWSLHMARRTPERALMASASTRHSDHHNSSSVHHNSLEHGRSTHVNKFISDATLEPAPTFGSLVKQFKRQKQLTPKAGPRGGGDLASSPALAVPPARSVSRSGAVTGVTSGTGSTGESGSSTGGGIVYQMTSTFIFLTMAEITLWIFSVLSGLFQLLPFVRGIAISSTSVAVILALESSFELLVKIQARTRKRRRVKMQVLPIETAKIVTVGFDDHMGGYSSSPGLVTVDAAPDLPPPSVSTRTSSSSSISKGDPV
ncbi:hypothetical protein BC828DRAFT_392622 [Blastocladiella britannica]|nr:hypothetical protein BC828DRAFT_392622 [Blastocladiella britannica]